MAIQNVLASIAVTDLARASAWYEQVLGHPADSRPMPSVAEWKFPRGGWLQVYELPERAGPGSCTLAVDSVDEQIAHLDRLGIDTAQRTRSDKVKTVMVTDPDGSHLAFAEATDPTLAH